jgi:flavin-dependent dehydrogenase
MGHLHDVVILGAGLAGGSMANVMAEMGWETVLIDRYMFPRHKVCGEFLSPESQKIMGALGLDTLVRSLHPSEMDKARLILPNGVSLEIPLPGTALGVSRYVLDSTLHLAVNEKGGIVETGITVTSITPGERGYRVETQDKLERRTFEARAVIGAWGRNPRSGLTAYYQQAPHKMYVGVKSHFEGIKPDPVVELYFFPGGYAGVSPIEGGRTNVAALLTKQAFHCAGKTVQGVMETAARFNPAFQQRLANGRIVPGSQAAVAPVETNRQLTAWDLIPHIGDAAAVIPPLCGDGMAMALRSVELCAHWADGYLHGKHSLSEWRHEYTQSLRREFTGPVRWGRLLQFMLGNPVLSPLLFRLGGLSPSLAFRLVQATRLK